MRRSPLPRFSRTRLLSIAAVVIVLLGLSWHSLFSPAFGAQLGQRSLLLSNNEVSTAAIYDLSFSISTAGTLGSIEIEFCSNDPFPADPCTVPSGLDASAATLTAQTGQAGFSIDGSSTANKLILTRTAASDSIGPVSYTFSNITNPSDAGSYYARLQTFASTDASGNSSDYGGIAFAIVNSVSVNAEVPPYLIFCTGVTIPQFNCASASGNYIDFGELSSQHTDTGTSQMLTATNAGSGYNITLTGTTLESGNNVITPLATNDVSRPGTSQFGINLRANVSPSIGSDPTGAGSGMPTPNYDQPNFYRFVPDEIIATYPTTDNVRVYTASYIVNVPPAQAAGIYVSTITYICLATF